MRIDRPDEPDEDDAAVVNRDAVGKGDAADNREPDAAEIDSGACSAAARAAYIAEFRADVEARYQAAWSEAVPALREAWAEHESKYPHPERSRSTVDHDGSWRGDGNLKLSPDQNAEVGHGCERICEVGNSVILPTMLRVEANDPERHLIGLEHYLKATDRLKEKVADELQPPSTLTARQALSTVSDGVRFTLCYGDSGYADGVRADTERLKALGFELIRLRNTWASDQYKGINSQWRERESGVRFEVQFHTQVSFEAKQLSHKAYERLRSTAAQDDERDELEEFQTAVCARINIPPGAIGIEEYPLEGRDGQRDHLQNQLLQDR